MRDSDKVPAEELPAGVAEEGDLGPLVELLGAPFDETEIKFKPGVVAGNRALALPYVDARAIQDRLDEALGVAGWQDEYECLPDGSVVCRLRLKINGEWITKMDVGGQSEQPDEGDRRKAAFSDALKRAAVKFGIGRYLYRQEAQWVDYDAQKKKFVKPPRLPASAMPKKAAAQVVKPPKLAETPVAAPARPAEAKRKGKKDLPANGKELHDRLTNYDAQLAAQGLCKPGELVKHVSRAGGEAGYGPDLSAWSGPAIAFAAEETKTFEAQCRNRKGERKEVA
jgi:hypothetical protein